MRTLDRFFEIEFLTYSDIAGLRLSLYHVLVRKTLLRLSYLSLRVCKEFVCPYSSCSDCCIVLC